MAKKRSKGTVPAEGQGAWFVLIESDPAASLAVRFWCEERVRLGLNRSGDWKIRSAVEWAERVEARLRARLARSQESPGEDSSC